MVGNVNNLCTGAWPLIICWRNWSGTFGWRANGIPHTCSIIGWRENERVRLPSGTPKWSNVPLPVVFLQPSSQLYPQPLPAHCFICTFFRLLKVWQKLSERARASGLTFITAVDPGFTGGRFVTAQKDRTSVGIHCSKTSCNFSGSDSLDFPVGRKLFLPWTKLGTRVFLRTDSQKMLGKLAASTSRGKECAAVGKVDLCCMEMYEKSIC